jgi:hypothetical protein
MTSAIFIAAALFLILYGFFIHVSTLRWDEAELRELERIELHLAHILRMLDTPDVRMLLEEPTARDDLLREFSTFLKEDVSQLLKLGGLGVSSLILVGVFLLSYHLIRFKARVFSGRHDLRFLSRLELALFRTMR